MTTLDPRQAAKKYACITCGHDKWIPYDESKPPLRIRTGCEECGTIRQLGQVPWGLPKR